ncbi:serine/threonine-protein kinase mph1 [Carica papaya]|uniref:serine/threonine-protein kinase mph1 n=1 Tax=Carica papaya TaxID=3649 RepID=UPI000B8CC996|nr:serine/threonine-protein kinase mph1 [Carica papaya]
MDREANLPVPSASVTNNLIRPILIQETSSSSSSSISSCSSPDFLRHVQAAFKRHRPLGKMQSNNIGPKRSVVPQRVASRNSVPDVDTLADRKKSDSLKQNQAAKVLITHTKNTTVVGESHEDASVTPPSISGTITSAYDDNLIPFGLQRDFKPIIVSKESNPSVESQLVDGQKKVQFLTGDDANGQEMEWDASNHMEASAITVNKEPRQHNPQTMESEISLKSHGASSLVKRTMFVQDQLHQFSNFLSQPATQSSVVGSSCATTISIHSTSAPMLNSTTYVSCSHQEGSLQAVPEPLGDFNVNSEPINRENAMPSSFSSVKDTSAMLVDQAVTAEAATSAIDTQVEVQECDNVRQKQDIKVKENEVPRSSHPNYDKSKKNPGFSVNVNDVQPHASLPKKLPSDLKLEPYKQEKQEKVASGKGASAPRKRSYDPDLFFKVNGKFYQRLGKIGSGGSSEVHKVISSDCTIYALKKIKLKGRDYATAYGFCQEIEYLNKLKGKTNIIQLIDYEVTDKTLLQEVMSGSMSNKDGRVKDDGCIYMVLEYGEIDLAHMLSQKWKEIDGSNQIIDENWLRFYWQQILQAVNTIHEERIVHSDLKPANFLLVKGSLKLIDFGIAKAIMSDTTNIQRDSQVGTLSYMSPEAFMCNESDANGNAIKCGRPSDIWSLGCILYQMVYGRTPFAEYKTFWAKFKVITDPNHKITYEPVSNPWLLDIMKKCLAWDRNERWRIPQLLEHPFLVPPVPPQSSSSQNKNVKLLQLMAEACGNDQEASMICLQLSQLLKDPLSSATELSTSRVQQCKLLLQMSKLCYQLQECLAKSEAK